jgi:hypothetical protein
MNLRLSFGELDDAEPESNPSHACGATVRFRALDRMVLRRASGPGRHEAPTSHQVHALKITVLITNVAGDPHAGDGEWGYSA